MTKTLKTLSAQTNRSRGCVAAVMAAALCAALSVTPAIAEAATACIDAEKMKREGESNDIAAARINEEGKALVRGGKYYNALDLFHCAVTLFPISNAIFNIGSMHYTLKQYEEAFPYIEQTLKAPLAPEQREIVLKYRATLLDRLKVSHKDILVQTNPPGAMLSLNGKMLPFAAPTRILVPFGAADIRATYPGFEPINHVIDSSPTRPPTDAVIRLKREEPMATVSVRCPAGADVFVDGTMKGFDIVRDRVLAGDHTVRCGKTKISAAFERSVTVRRGVGNNFDFSAVTE